MKIPHRSLPAVWLAVIVTFTGASALVFGVLWANSGGKIPFVGSTGYRVSVPIADVSNIVYYSDVRVAGVAVGKVVGVDRAPGHATLTLQLDSDVAPLHEGVAVRVGEKSLIEESFVGIKDGSGQPLASGAVLPASSVVSGVDLDQVLNSLDPESRTQLGSTIRSLGQSTGGTSKPIGGLLEGLGDLGRGGSTALGALAQQSHQLQSLSANTTVLLNALDTQNGQIAALVDAGQQITSATSDGRDDLQATIRQMPGLLHSTATASDKLTTLAGALDPVADDLRRASPRLTSALNELPAVSHDLRATLPDLDATLQRAPGTLDRVPTFGTDTRALVPPVRVAMSDLDPVLAYLQPYGHDVAAFFTNFGSQAAQGDANGNWARISLLFSEQTLRGYPVSTNVGPLNRSNAYPAPGGSVNPKPFTGTYPRLKRDGE